MAFPPTITPLGIKSIQMNKYLRFIETVCQKVIRYAYIACFAATSHPPASPSPMSYNTFFLLLLAPACMLSFSVLSHIYISFAPSESLHFARPSWFISSSYKSPTQFASRLPTDEIAYQKKRTTI